MVISRGEINGGSERDSHKFARWSCSGRLLSFNDTRPSVTLDTVYSTETYYIPDAQKTFGHEFYFLTLLPQSKVFLSTGLHSDCGCINWPHFEQSSRPMTPRERTRCTLLISNRGRFFAQTNMRCQLPHHARYIVCMVFDKLLFIPILVLNCIQNILMGILDILHSCVNISTCKT